MLKRSPIANAAGARNTLVCIEKAEDAEPDAAHSVLPNYVPYCERYAEAMLTSGREFTMAMQTVGMLQGILKLPYDSKTKLLTERDRIKIGDRILNFAAKPMNEGEANEKIVLWCVEV